MSDISKIPMPADFRYKKIFAKGKPEHPRSDPFRARHPRMDAGRRAKLFAPFDALKGFSESIAAKQVLYVGRKELSAEDRAETDRRLRILYELTKNSRLARRNRVQVAVTFFVPCPDPGHEAFGQKGSFIQASGICMGVDPVVSRSLLVDQTSIAFEDILKIESPDGIFGAAREYM